MDFRQPLLRSSNFVSLFIALVVSYSIFAQKHDKDIIFSIDDEVISKSEFLAQYEKNANSGFDNDSLSIEEYVDLYLNFKLKVKAAKDLGYDTIPKFLNEYNNYRRQLADKYISNGKVTEDMVKDIYFRMTNEVNASHILVQFGKNPQPADTLKAYNKAIDILKELEDGANFEAIAVQYSDDPSSKMNKGNLGWFKAYKMVYPFETAVYELESGEISQPVRTQFGYHIIKKNGQRPSKGKLIIAHIMKNLKSSDSTYNPETEIYQIYNKIYEGENFSNLAKQFSDHKPTASKGGELSPFSVGQLNSPEFGEVAFSLDKIDSISKPFQTQFGWHIAKYIDNIPVEPLEKLKPEIIKKIKTSDRSKRLIENIKEDLQQKYNVEVNYEVLSLIENRIDESIFKYKWTYETADKDQDVWILKIDDNLYMLNDFMAYIQKQQRSLTSNTISDKINTAFDKYTYAKLIEFHNKNLENVSPEFASEIKTYYEGLLLFEVMEQKIWKPAQNDSVALQQYYESNKDDFKSKTKIDGILASSNNRKEAKAINKVIDSKSIEELKKDFPKAIFKNIEELDIDDPSLPRDIVLQENYSKVYANNGQFNCIYTTKIHPSKILKLEEVRGQVINKLQKQSEESWLNELKETYNININKDLIKKLSS